MLTDLKEMGESEKTKQQEIITAQTALENLYLKNKIHGNTHVKKRKLVMPTLPHLLLITKYLLQRGT